MNIETRTESDILFLTLEGDLLGEHHGTEIIQVVNDALSKDDVKSCAVNMAGIRYMNSSGIGVLITVMTKFKNRSGEVVLINPSDQIKKLLKITKLDTVFSVVASDDEAKLKIK